MPRHLSTRGNARRITVMPNVPDVAQAARQICQTLLQPYLGGGGDGDLGLPLGGGGLGGLGGEGGCGGEGGGLGGGGGLQAMGNGKKASSQHQLTSAWAQAVRFERELEGGHRHVCIQVQRSKCCSMAQSVQSSIRPMATFLSHKIPR